MKRIVIFLFLITQYLNANDRIRDYNNQINFIFYLSNRFNVTEIGTLMYPENEYKLSLVSKINTPYH